MRFLRCLAPAMALFLGTAALEAATRGDRERPPRLTLTELRQPTGGASVARPASGAKNSPAWLSVDLEPATLGPRFDGQVELRNLTVVGDHERIEWQTGPGTPVHTFDRRSTLVRDGVTLSLFDLSFPASELSHTEPLPIRFDCRTPPACDTHSWPFRVRPSAMRRAKVVRINDRVQYSSHVVNIVAPYDTSIQHLPTGDRFFWAPEVAATFFEHFTETYEELAFVPVQVHSAPVSGAAGFMVYNDVEGTGIEPYDGRAFWGGSQVQLSALVYYRGGLPGNWLSVHESGHHWGFRFDLFAVAGTTPTGDNECAPGPGHTPLIADRPSLMSHCLNINADRSPNLRIARQGNRWVLAEPERPLTYHPLMLYAMGLLPSSEVPPLWLPRRQSLPRPTEPGTRIGGEFVEVTIEDVIAYYGPRTGPPIPDEWRRAVIVVSPHELLSKKDLAWFNFFARRVSDPDVTGIEDLKGTPSMEFATLGGVDLRTEIRPKGRSPVTGAFEVSYPQIGKRDLPGVKLDRKLPTRFRAGRSYRLSGRVTESATHTSVDLSLGSQSFSTELAKNGRFSLELRLDAEERGPRWLVLGMDGMEVVLGRVAPVYLE